MNLIKKFSLVLLLLNQGAYASKALYSITPETSSTVQVPLNSTANINYRVQNQTKQTQSLSFQNSFGITQTVQSGFCDNPFMLAPNESCLLSLVVDGSKITASKSVIGPEICKTNASFFCSLPLLENRLNIEITNPEPSETHILIANNGPIILGLHLGFISSCLVGDAGGLENCQKVDSNRNNLGKASGVAYTASQYLYTADNEPDDNVILICSFDTDSIDCNADSAGSLLQAPRTVYINNNNLYAINGEISQVIKCDINPENGRLFTCTSTGSGFNNPQGSMTIANGYAYIPNSGDSTVSICSVEPGDGTLNSCRNVTPNPNVSSNSGITISGSYAYIIGLNITDVVACEVDANDGGLSNCQKNTGILAQNDHLGIAVLNDYLYISSNGPNSVQKCRINGLDVSTCELTGSGFVGPAGNMTFFTR